MVHSAHALVMMFVVGSGMAQAGTSLAVVAPVVLQNSAASTATRNVGPVPAAGLLLTTGVNLNYSQLRIQPAAVQPATGAVGWNILTDLRTTTSGPGPGTANITGRLELAFTQPQLRTGVLVLTPSAWSPVGVGGDVTIDLDRNGTPDFVASTAEHIEVPLTVGPQGTSLWVDLGLSVATPWISGNTVGGCMRTWNVLFLPDGYGVTRFATGCLGGFQWGRNPGDLELQFSLYDPLAPGPGVTIHWGFLVLGFAPASVTLPFPPNCVLQVAAPGLVHPNQSSSPWVLRWSLPTAVLPAGLDAYAQVVWQNWNGNVYTTDVLRTF